MSPLRRAGAHAGGRSAIFAAVLVIAVTALGGAAIAVPPDRPVPERGAQSPEPDDPLEPAAALNTDVEGAIVDPPALITETGSRRAPPVSTDSLYDFRPFAAVDPAYSALYEAWKTRNWAQTVALGEALAASTADPSLRSAALHLVALAWERRRKMADAERVWRRIAQKGVLAWRARDRLAELALDRRDVDEAIAQLAALPSSHPLRDRASLQIAELELDRGRVGPAWAVLERLDPLQFDSRNRARLELLIGDASRRKGDPEGAAGHYLKVWQTDLEPFATTAGERLAALARPPSPLDQIERILARSSSDRKQRRAWRKEADALAAGTPGLRDYVAGTLLAADRKQREAAVVRLQRAVDQIQDPLALAEARYRLGDTLGKLNRDEDAVAVLAPILEAVVGPEMRARTLRRLHKLYRALGRPLDAEQVLVRLLADFPDLAHRELAVWALAWRRFRVGDLPEALRLLAEIETRYGHLHTGAWQPWRAKALYWQGRCLARLGQLDQALDRWTTVVNTWPQTYYGVLALDRVRELDVERARRLAGDPPQAPAAEPFEPSLARLRVERHRELDEAVVLVRMGLVREGRATLQRQLRKGLPRDGVHLLATLYQLDDRARMAFAVLQRHTRRAARPDDATADVWRESFPTPFAEAADAAVSGAGIPHALLYAIARHESAFRPTARSHAGALGLIQILPAVADNVAKVHGIAKRRARALFQPDWNLRLGALYLLELGRFYRGNNALVIAAYNAGPYAVRSWLAREGPVDTDVFVEAIPYAGTRAYVMQVTASMQSYAWLYPKWQELGAVAAGRRPRAPDRLGPFMTGDRNVLAAPAASGLQVVGR